MSSHYIFYKINIDFGAIVDSELVLNPTLYNFYSLELPLIAPVIARQAYIE